MYSSFRQNYGMRQNYSGRRRAGCGCVSTLLIVVLVIGGFVFLVGRARNGVTLTVGAHPTLIGNNCTGTVFVQAGPANQVTLSGIFPQYTQDNAANTIELDECGGITITVPPVTDLQIDTAEAVTVFGVSGTLKLSTNGSRIALEKVTLEGNSKIDDNGGPIVFNGSLAPKSTSTVSDNGGSIDMTLPADTSCQLKVTGISGPLVSNFPGVQAPADTTSGIQTTIGGSSSTVNLTLEVNDTAMVLRRGS
jgi:hypothetical protein